MKVEAYGTFTPAPDTVPGPETVDSDDGDQGPGDED